MNKFLIALSFCISTCFSQEKEVSIYIQSSNAKVNEISIFLGDLYGNINVLDKGIQVQFSTYNNLTQYHEKRINP